MYLCGHRRGMQSVLEGQAQPGVDWEVVDGPGHGYEQRRRWQAPVVRHVEHEAMRRRLCAQLDPPRSPHGSEELDDPAGSQSTCVMHNVGAEVSIRRPSGPELPLHKDGGPSLLLILVVIFVVVVVPR